MTLLVWFAFAGGIFLLAQPVFANDYWTNREICRAATKVYFFLKRMPKDGSDAGPYMGFVSEGNNYYTCFANKGIAYFVWINKSGETMESRSTRYQSSGRTLIVKSDTATETFKRERAVQSKQGQVKPKTKFICVNPRREYLVEYTPGSIFLVLNPDTDRVRYTILEQEDSEQSHIVTSRTPATETAKLYLRPNAFMEFWSDGKVIQTDKCRKSR